MLSTLHIQNLAVVADVTLSFEPGLNVVTGSTGAGKSLILGAVNFLLGARVSPQSIRAGEEKAVVEGIFLAGRMPADPDGLLEAAAGPSGGSGPGRLPGGTRGIELRREVHRSGRSFAFVDGRPCGLKQLQALAEQLIEPHGQNEQLRLKFPENHAVYLDHHARGAALVSRYRQALEAYKEADRELEKFDGRIAALREKKELFEHRLSEIERARLAPGEKEKLEETIRVLEHANEVFENLGEIERLLYEDDESAVTLVSRARAKLSRIAHLDSKLAALSRELESSEIAIKESAAVARNYLEGLEFDPDDLEKKQSRLAELIDLERRYRISVEELLAESERWKRELALVEFEDEERSKLSARRAECLAGARALALELRLLRRKAAAGLDKAMTGALGELMMAGAVFRTEVSLEEDEAGEVEVEGARVRLQAAGVDHVEFHVRTNPGELEGPLAEVASTGELSRIALALKEIVSFDGERFDAGGSKRVGGSSSPAAGPDRKGGSALAAGSGIGDGGLLVFDEVDVGVGADLGDMIAERIQRLARRYQIVCITHMPQIAARAAHHLVVGKRAGRGRTFTEVSRVAGDERVKEIARMLGGREGSEKRLALAREMLQKGKSGDAFQVRP